MKTTYTLFFIMILGNLSSYAQSTDISGILQTQGVNNEQCNSICIRFENSMNADDQSSIQREFTKYNEIIKSSFQTELDADYIVIKYINPMSPNQLLAILDKINKRGHYLEGGIPVYYHKDNSIYFIR